MKSFVFLIPILLLIGSTSIHSSEPKGICLNAEEKKLYDMIMEYRESKGLETIPLSIKLTEVAQTHAQDLATNYVFDQDNKCNPHSWSKKGKWTSCCYTSDHKQASCMWKKPKEITGYTSNGYEIAYYSSSGANAQQGLDGWKVSPGHNPLLINLGSWSNVKWNAIGVGIYKEYGIVWFGEVADTDATQVKVCE
ncbi:MAG TPA: CAP domain-containing protein [Chryseolinea sp.]|nr:CAP domain-containing protein [Chryseolinea sp.]HPH45901.1 CAP domain-containing protein [Chryseolinea sp.]HPM29842.1 CAP domain-containing protein [Chryseolinea sp.]